MRRHRAKQDRKEVDARSSNLQNAPWSYGYSARLPATGYIAFNSFTAAYLGVGGLQGWYTNAPTSGFNLPAVLKNTTSGDLTYVTVTQPNLLQQRPGHVCGANVALVLLFLLGHPALAQTVINPRTVEFVPSADHSVLAGDSQPMVSRVTTWSSTSRGPHSRSKRPISASPRTGALTIAGRAFTITQSGVVPPAPPSGIKVIIQGGQ